MKKLFFSSILVICIFTTHGQNGVFMPKTVDSTLNMYPCDTCLCYILVIENIGFNDWAESEPITWYHALEWMSKGNNTYPGSYWILNICDLMLHKKQYEYIKWSGNIDFTMNIQFVLKGDF